MLVIQWTKFGSMVDWGAWFWHSWKIPIFNGVASIPRGYLQGAAVKVTNARGLRILGIELSILTVVPRESEAR